MSPFFHKRLAFGDAFAKLSFKPADSSLNLGPAVSQAEQIITKERKLGVVIITTKGVCCHTHTLDRFYRFSSKIRGPAVASGPEAL